MISIQENTLSIQITDSEPAQRREQLIKAIAATMRWMANNSHGELYSKDSENQYVLAQLLEELVMLE